MRFIDMLLLALCLVTGHGPAVVDSVAVGPPPVVIEAFFDKWYSYNLDSSNMRIYQFQYDFRINQVYVLPFNAYFRPLLAHLFGPIYLTYEVTKCHSETEV